MSVATEAADAAVHVRRVIVINVIDRAIEPHPLDWLTAFPALLHRLQLGIVLSPLACGSSCTSRVGHVRLRGHFHEAVTIPAIHPQLCHVNIVRKRHRLGRLVSDFGVFRRGVIPRGSGQAAQAITITQTTILSGIQFVQRGKKLAMVLDGLRADAAQSPSSPRRFVRANY